MEFLSKCIYKNGSVKGDKVSSIELESKIIENKDDDIPLNYIEYIVRFDRVYSMFIPVSVEKIDDCYQLFFIYTELYGHALNEFIYYLEENHERNIVELSI